MTRLLKIYYELILLCLYLLWLSSINDRKTWTNYKHKMTINVNMNINMFFIVIMDISIFRKICQRRFYGRARPLYSKYCEFESWIVNEQWNFLLLLKVQAWLRVIYNSYHTWIWKQGKRYQYRIALVCDPVSFLFWISCLLCM